MTLNKSYCPSLNWYNCAVRDRKHGWEAGVRTIVRELDAPGVTLLHHFMPLMPQLTGSIWL